MDEEEIKKGSERHAAAMMLHVSCFMEGLRRLNFWEDDANAIKEIKE